MANKKKRKHRIFFVGNFRISILTICNFLVIFFKRPHHTINGRLKMYNEYLGMKAYDGWVLHFLSIGNKFERVILSKTV